MKKQYYHVYAYSQQHEAYALVNSYEGAKWYSKHQILPKISGQSKKYIIYQTRLTKYLAYLKEPFVLILDIYNVLR